MIDELKFFLGLGAITLVVVGVVIYFGLKLNKAVEAQAPKINFPRRNSRRSSREAWLSNSKTGRPFLTSPGHQRLLLTQGGHLELRIIWKYFPSNIHSEVCFYHSTNNEG